MDPSETRSLATLARLLLPSRAVIKGALARAVDWSLDRLEAASDKAPPAAPDAAGDTEPPTKN